MARCLGAILFIGLLCANANADRVMLANGDQLKGKVIKVEDDKMTFKADMVGEVTIEMAKKV